MVTLKEDSFDLFQGETVRRFTWENSSGFRVQIISYGATITSIMVPDSNGELKDVVLGFDNVMTGYRRPENPYFGATVGRCANRIGKGQFTIEGRNYQVVHNNGNNHLHGGIVGFDKYNWEAHVDGLKVVFSHLSKDNDENYPGAVTTHVIYEVTADSCINITYKARSTKPTIVNLTNHSYYNLAGHESGSYGLYQHVVQINADRYTEVDADSIPTGRILPVKGTFYDLREPTDLGEAMKDGQGYDYNFCLNKEKENEMSFAARATHPQSGRYLEVHTDQPGVQFYTGNSLPSAQDPAIQGKGGVGYRIHGALCFEAQNYPDAVNHVEFPNVILKPGSDYLHRTMIRFGASAVSVRQM